MPGRSRRNGKRTSVVPVVREAAGNNSAQGCIAGRSSCAGRVVGGGSAATAVVAKRGGRRNSHRSCLLLGSFQDGPYLTCLLIKPHLMSGPSTPAEMDDALQGLLAEIAGTCAGLDAKGVVQKQLSELARICGPGAEAARAALEPVAAEFRAVF